MPEPILSVRNLNVKFSLRGQTLHAIRDVSLDVMRGESLAIVGESGSGKSVFVKSFMGLNDKNGWIDSGEILYEGKNLAALKSEKEWGAIRGGEIAMVMQDPMTSRARQYPHEFSGGMRQRVVIAVAVACKPKILICDEPTTALDVTIQAQILKLIKNLIAKYHLTAIYITHDLGVVANVAERICVMYGGDILEIGTAEEVFYDPQHPYTWALLSSLPQLGVKGEKLFAIRGTPPNLFGEIKGDPFAPRNPYALKIDYEERPPFFEVSPTHKARTWLLDPRAPKVERPEIIRKLSERRLTEHG